MGERSPKRYSAEASPWIPSCIEFKGWVRNWKNKDAEGLVHGEGEAIMTRLQNELGGAMGGAIDWMQTQRKMNHWVIIVKIQTVLKKG